MTAAPATSPRADFALAPALRMRLLGALLMVASGTPAWAWGYAAYSVLNAVSAWLILTGRV